MKKTGRTKKKRRFMGTMTYLLVLLTCYALSTVGGYLYFKDYFAFESTFMADIEARKSEESKSGAGKQDERLYSYDQLKGSPGGGSADAMDAILVTAEDLIRREISRYRTRLLDLYLDRRGVIYIDLGNEISKNFHGDASEELGLITGIYSELKSSIPGLTAVKILIEGKEVESFGGHIDISRPIRGRFVEGV
jgi:hypothetical protein